MSKRIEAVVEINRCFDGAAAWPVISDPFESLSPYLHIYPRLSDKEIGSLILTACLYNQIEISPAASVTLQRFLSDGGFVLPGGLRFSEDAGAVIVPGCCCGLEDWREWLDAPHGKNSIWTGHDPAPEVEYFGNNIRIWQDKKGDGVEFIDFETAEMERLLLKVRLELEGFLIRLEKWVAHVSPGIERAFVQYFAENLKIGDDA